MSFEGTFNAFGSLGEAYRQGKQRDALAALGAQIQAGDYSGAAKTAFDAGDVGAGLKVLSLGQQLQQSRDAAGAFGALGALYGGGGGADANSAGVPRPVTQAGPSVPSFLDTSSPSGQYTANLFKRESNNNDFAQAPTSSARGAGQFTKGTWNRLASQSPDLNLTPVGNGQDGRTDRAQMLRATNALTSQNESVLQGSGLPVTDASRYALHFLGAGGGRRLVAGAMRNPDAPAASYADAAQVAANRNVFFNRDGSPKSAGQVLNDFGRSFGGGGSAPVQQASASAPGPVAYADDEAGVQALEQRMGMTPPASASRQVASADPQADLPAPGAQEAAFYVPPAGTVANPAPGLSGAGEASGRPVPVASLPSSSSNAPAPVGGSGGRVMTMPGDGGASDGGTSSQAQLSVQAPAHIEQAGFPKSAATAVGVSPAGSQQRIGVLLKLSAMPGISEGQAATVRTLLANEIDQTKLPDSAKQYLFARSPVGGGFDGTYAEFVGKSRDEGSKITAQIKAREDYVVSQGLDPKEPGNRAWIMGGKTTTGHVLKPGDILAGPNGQTLAQNASAASSMPDETANFLADRVLAGDTRALVGLGRGAQGAENLAKIQGLVAQKAREQGIDPTDIQQRAADAMGLGAQARSLGTSAGRMAAAAYEAQGAIQLGLDASAAVPRTSFVPLNRAYQMVQANTGDPALKQFVAANNTIINTFARAISPTGAPTVSDKEHAREMLSTADSSEAYAAVLQQMQKEIDMAHRAPEQARRGLEAERQAAKRGGSAQQPERYTANPLSPSPQPQSQPAPQQYREGQTASGPGGQKVIFSRGQWVPLNAAPSTTASPNAGGAL
jgi:hypothetical protein